MSTVVHRAHKTSATDALISAFLELFSQNIPIDVLIDTGWLQSNVVSEWIAILIRQDGGKLRQANLVLTSCVFTIRTDHRSLLYQNIHGSRKVLQWKLDILLVDAPNPYYDLRPRIICYPIYINHMYRHIYTVYIF